MCASGAGDRNNNGKRKKKKLQQAGTIRCLCVRRETGRMVWLQTRLAASTLSGRRGRGVLDTKESAASRSHRSRLSLVDAATSLH